MSLDGYDKEYDKEGAPIIDALYNLKLIPRLTALDIENILVIKRGAMDAVDAINALREKSPVAFGLLSSEQHILDELRGVPPDHDQLHHLCCLANMPVPIDALMKRKRTREGSEDEAYERVAKYIEAMLGWHMALEKKEKEEKEKLQH